MTWVAVLALVMVIAAVVVVWPEFKQPVLYNGMIYMLGVDPAGGSDTWVEIGYAVTGWTVLTDKDPDPTPFEWPTNQTIKFTGQLNDDNIDALQSLLNAYGGPDAPS